MFGHIPRWYLFTALGLFLIGVALLLFPSYDIYCQSDNTYYYECAPYSVAAAVGAWIDSHDGIVTALGTLAIAGFTLALWRATDLLGSEAKKAGETSAKLAEISEKQLAIEGRQICIQTKQHELERLRFFATHRPRLKIRFVRKRDGDLPTISFSIVNSGSSRAIIRTSKVSAEFLHIDDIPDFHDEKRGGLINFVGQPILDPGSSCKCEVTTSNRHYRDKLVLRVYGYVVYSNERERLDKDGAVIYDPLTTYFMREFNPMTGRFEPVADPDYNAED